MPRPPPRSGARVCGPPPRRAASRWPRSWWPSRWWFLTYLAGKLAYWLRDVILMMLAAGFLALILNPLVVALQRWRIRRCGWAVAAVTIWTVPVFAGLA